jgi:hypothetical protein
VDPGDLKDPLEKMALEQRLNVRHKAASQVLPIGKRLTRSRPEYRWHSGLIF